MRNSLEPCLEQMRPKFREAYLELSVSQAIASDVEHANDALQHSAESSLAEAMSDIMGSLKSAEAQNMAKRYQTRIGILLRRCIEDTLSQASGGMQSNTATLSSEDAAAAQSQCAVVNPSIRSGSFLVAFQVKSRK